LLDSGSSAGIVARVIVNEVDNLLDVLTRFCVKELERKRGRLRVDLCQSDMLDGLGNGNVAKNGETILQPQLVRIVDAYN